MSRTIHPTPLERTLFRAKVAHHHTTLATIDQRFRLSLLRQYLRDVVDQRKAKIRRMK